MNLETEYHIKYYEYWRMNYGFLYVIKHFISITKMYNLLKELSIAYDMEEDFYEFFKRPIKRPSRQFTNNYLGVLTENWKNKKAINYQIYLERIFNG